MKKVICSIIICLLTPQFTYSTDYMRIVSLAPAATRSLYELGAEEYVKGITTYCPKGTIQKDVIGTLLEPNLEKIVFLRPDLIVASKDGNNKAVVEKLQRLGFEVYVMEKSENFSDICDNYYDLAKKISKTQNADKIISKAKNLLNKIHSKLNANISLKTFWEISAKPLYTAGGKSFVNDYNLYSNTLNLYGNIDKNYFQVDIEDIIVRNPDIILLVNLGYVSREEVDLWNKYKMINAVRNKKIFILNLKNMFAPTPMSFVSDLGVLVETIYGDIFDVK